MGKKSITYLLLIIICINLIGCNELDSYQPIDDINDLGGRRVGVLLACATDYLYTQRDDMTLKRYNSEADMVTALSSRRVDALALEQCKVYHIMNSYSGLRVVDTPIAEHSYVFYVAHDKPALLNEFNEFITNFKDTETYLDIARRANSKCVFEHKKVNNIKGDKILRVAVNIDGYPSCYKQGKVFLGFDIEIITHFANAYNYTIEYTECDYLNMALHVEFKTSDIGIGDISNAWNEDILLANIGYITEPILTESLLFIEIDGNEAIKNISTLH